MTMLGQSTKKFRPAALILLACIHSTASAYHIDAYASSTLLMSSPQRRCACSHRRSRVIVQGTSSSSSFADDPTMAGTSEDVTLPPKSSSFDAGTFEADRLLRDALAMNDMDRRNGVLQPAHAMEVAYA